MTTACLFSLGNALLFSSEHCVSDLWMYARSPISRCCNYLLKRPISHTMTRIEVLNTISSLPSPSVHFCVLLWRTIALFQLIWYKVPSLLKNRQSYTRFECLCCLNKSKFSRKWDCDIERIRLWLMADNVSLALIYIRPQPRSWQ